MEKADFDRDNHPEGTCQFYCRIHWFYDFAAQRMRQYPRTFYHPLPPAEDGRKQWGKVWVGVGPPAYYPKRPTNDQMTNMQAHCPHTQGDLTCNGCLRHTFHPLEIK